jgi:hypothetical protein
MSRMDANFGLNNTKAAVDVSYDLSGASFVYPQEGSNSEGITPSAKRESCIYLIFHTIATLHPAQSMQLDNRGQVSTPYRRRLEKRHDRWSLVQKFHNFFFTNNDVRAAQSHALSERCRARFVG